MKPNLIIDSLILLVVFAACVAVLLILPQPTQQTVNCGLAEISPDFTERMRQECRMIRGTKL